MRQPRRSLMDFSVPTANAVERPLPPRPANAQPTRPLRGPEQEPIKTPRKPTEREIVAAAANRTKPRRAAATAANAGIGHNRPPVALEDVASAAIGMMSEYRNLMFAQMRNAMTASLGLANTLAAGLPRQPNGGAEAVTPATPTAEAPQIALPIAEMPQPREFLRDGARRFWENELQLLDIMEEFATGWFKRRRTGTEAALTASQSMCMAPGTAELAREWHDWADGASERLTADRMAVQRYMQGFGALAVGRGGKKS